MVKLYRGVLEKPIIYPKSIFITTKNIESIDFKKVIYGELSVEGAMGNMGGILLYVLENKDNLITYETNAFIDKEAYKAVSEKIDLNIGLFNTYNGGFGNYVYVKKGINLEIDDEYNCFWYHSKDTKFRVNSSVVGVFNHVVNQMRRQHPN